MNTIPPRGLAPSEIAFIRLTLHDDGGMTIAGNVADVHLALKMLDSARDAVSHQIGKPNSLEPHGAGLVLPYKHVQAPQNPVYPLEAVGERKP
jgi:hypothetical protein